MYSKRKDARAGKYLIIFQSHSTFVISLENWRMPERKNINNPLTKQVFGNNSWLDGALESALQCEKENPFPGESGNHKLTVLPGLLSSKERYVSLRYALYTIPCISRSRPHKFLKCI